MNYTCRSHWLECSLYLVLSTLFFGFSLRDPSRVMGGLWGVGAAYFNFLEYLNCGVFFALAFGVFWSMPEMDHGGNLTSTE